MNDLNLNNIYRLYMEQQVFQLNKVCVSYIKAKTTDLGSRNHDSLPIYLCLLVSARISNVSQNRTLLQLWGINSIKVPEETHYTGILANYIFQVWTIHLKFSSSIPTFPQYALEPCFPFISECSIHKPTKALCSVIMKRQLRLVIGIHKACLQSQSIDSGGECLFPESV